MHLDATNSRNTDIESYLVQFLLTRICAEYETRLKILIERRCAKTKDGHLKRFAARSAKDVSKHFSIGDLKAILGRFGDDYHKTFDDAVVNKPAHVAWDSIYSNRQAVAHGGGAQMTLTELKTAYADSLEVLDWMATALALKPRDIRDLK